MAILLKLHDFVREVTNFVLRDDLYELDTKSNLERNNLIIDQTCDEYLHSESDSDFELANHTDNTERSEEDVTELKVLVELTTGKRVSTVDHATAENKDTKDGGNNTLVRMHSEDYKQFLLDKLPKDNQEIGEKHKKKTKKIKPKVTGSVKARPQDKKHAKKKNKNT